MKSFNRLAVLALAASALCGPALAQSAPVTGTVDVTGSVAEKCLFTSASPVLLDIGEMADAAGYLNEASLTSRDATLTGWCNGAASTIAVEASSMTNQDFTAAPPAGFDRVVDFTATAAANDVSASDSTLTAGPGSATTIGVFASDILVTFASAATPGSGRLVAGDYAGSVDVTLTPAS